LTISCLQARIDVVQWLEKEGLFRGTAGNEMRLGTCSRSGDVIEPVIKPQWWVECKALGAAAAKAVHDDKLKILPSPKTFLE
jgi:valyl-tRNA synthetase